MIFNWKTTFQTSQVSRFWFASPGLPVNKTKSPGYHKLVKSPSFFTFISRFFFLAIRLLFCISPIFWYQKTWIKSLVIRYRLWIGLLLTSDRKFWCWNHFQMALKNAHKDRTCMKKFLQTKICLYSSPLHISGLEQQFS